MGADAALQAELAGLQLRVRTKQRKSAALAIGAAAAAVLGLGLGAFTYATTVLCYARLTDIRLLRDPTDADRLTLAFRPLSRGRVGFGRGDENRETQLLDRIAPAEVGQSQEFQWRVRGVNGGDAVRVTYLDGWRRRTLELAVPEANAPAVVGGGESLSGRVLNAINKQPIAGATVRVVGSPLSARTDAAGNYCLASVPAGPVSLEVAADGFTSEILPRSAGGGESAAPVALSPGLEKGQIRVVLTWGPEARDLDAHLEGPLPKDQRFHIYYHQMGDLKSKEYVRLDADAQDGGGPETITVLGVLPGTYRYFVHDYSNRANPAASAIARSRAEVKVFQGGQTYRFRSDGTSAGNLWDVCTIEVTPQGATVAKVDRYEGAKMESLGLYAKRTLGDRGEWIGKYGGSAISEAAVAEGLQWLARHQGNDGVWSCETFGNGKDSHCEPKDRCDQQGQHFETAHTGLSLLAFQAGGHYYFNGTEYSDQVKKGLDWLVAQQHDDGSLIGSRLRQKFPQYHQYHMYEHGIAAFALADACAAAAAMSEPVRPEYLQAMKKAIEFIEKGQHKDGGWRYSTNLDESSDTSVTGWQFLALKSAREAGLPIPEECVKNVRRFLDARAMADNGRTGYTSSTAFNTEATTAVGMLGHQFLLDEPEAPRVRQAAAYLADYAERQWGKPELRNRHHDYYTWYNGTLAMFQAGGDEWRRWNEPVRDTLIELQRHTGCMRGSWDPSDRWGGAGGRIYSTALAVLTLETYYRYASQNDLDEGFEMSRSALSGGARPGDANASQGESPSAASDGGTDARLKASPKNKDKKRKKG